MSVSPDKPAPKDLITILAEFRVGFMALNMEPPDAVLMKTHEDGVRVLHELTQRAFITFKPNNVPGRPVEHPDGSVWMEVEVYGFKIRWPAMRINVGEGCFIWT